MACFSVSNIKITAVHATVPLTKAHNSDLSFLPPPERENLIKATGIRTRRIADDSTTAADLCLQSARTLLAELNWKADEVDVLVFVTQTPDYTIPGNSMLLQHQLGLSKNCLCFDINQGCAGYVYGLASIMSMMSAGKLKKGLLLVGDTITHTLLENDPTTVPIFSDAGSATSLEFDENANPTWFNLQTDGSGFDKIIVRNGGARNPSHISNEKDASLYMNGQDIFSFGLKEVAKNINDLLNQTSAHKEKIDYLVMHQANLLLNESIRKMTGISADRTLYSLQDYGNTSCGSIPVTIAVNGSNMRADRNKIVLSGFGVGLSWGSCITSLNGCKAIGFNEYGK